MKFKMKKFVAAWLVLILALVLGVIGKLVGSGEPVAEKIASSELKDGDQLILYHESSGYAVGQYASGRGLAPIYLASALSEDGQIINEIQPDTAVFTVERDENGCYLFKSEAGYLACGETGYGLYFEPEITELSLWTFEGDGVLFNESGQCYLEYYNSFTTYGKKTDENESAFVFSFFRLTDDMPVQTEGYVLSVFETSDVHGYLVDSSKESYEYRLAYIADKVNDARGGDNGSSDRTVLLDGGDIFQGNTLSNLMDGQPMAEAYELMEYDALAVGNHEFDWGIEKTAANPEYMEDIPWLASNLMYDGQRVSFADDFVILEKEAVSAEGEILQVRIGVIGFLENYESSILHSSFSGLGYSISEDYTIANNLAAELETTYGCDATIVLTHGDASEAAEGLGSATVVDLVLGGHSHQSVCGQTQWGLSYIQPEEYGQTYAYAELVFEGEKDGSAVLSGVRAAQTVSIVNNSSLLYNSPENAEELDTDVLALSEDAVQILEAELGQSIGYITTSVLKTEGIDGNERSTTGGNWVTGIFARAVDAEVGFYNSGGIRSELILPEGQETLEITVSDIYTMLPFGTGIWCYELSGGELLDLLHFSLGKGAGLYAHMSGIDCYYEDTTINALVKDGEVIYQDGEWKNGWEDRTIRVAAGEYSSTSVNDENLLYLLKDSAQLVSSDKIDNEAAVAVLLKEAAENDGFLYVDTQPHMIEGKFDQG